MLLFRLNLRPQLCVKHLKRCQSTLKKFEDIETPKIRNIGILAHIDAGKTTTTERMLYYSGLINQMGEVHHGNTVTDFMEQERERGITITSAAITFYWKKHQFNLIDTPGHIDFTMEVEQTLNVLDGAIVVLDGSAGVEAQTMTVWRQAEKYKIPRIIFVNKMDRHDANLNLCCKSIEDKLQATPLCLQLPLLENNNLTGIVDLLAMEKIMYEKQDKNLISKTELSKNQDAILWERAQEARASLIDKLSNFDDILAEKIISSESFDAISTIDIVNALRSVTLKHQEAVPVLLGSAYKNIGIQPLMNSVILYLPSPVSCNQQFQIFDNDLCARAFKVRHDKQKGPLVFLRVYNGSLNKNQKIYSIQQEQSEVCSKLYIAYADDLKEVDCVKTGNIAVVSGLKHVMSGDLVTGSLSAAQRAKNKNKSLFDMGAQIPEPVFFCSIEPPSLAYQSALEQALIELQREDPSLRVSNDLETGQTVLAGMGELHLEIIKDRILREYKVDAELGPLQISYLESLKAPMRDCLSTDMKIGNLKQSLTVELSLISKKDGSTVLKLDKTSEAASNLANIFPKHLSAIKQGVEIGLVHGPKIGCRLIDTEVILHRFEVGRGTSESIISATVTQLIQKILKNSETNILEPIMCLEIAAPDEYTSIVLGDLGRRRSEIRNVTMRATLKIINASVPLSELLGYATVLRTITSGTSTFTMEFDEYRIMSATEESMAIQRVRGF